MSVDLELVVFSGCTLQPNQLDILSLRIRPSHIHTSRPSEVIIPLEVMIMPPTHENVGSKIEGEASYATKSQSSTTTKELQSTSKMKDNWEGDTPWRSRLK